MKGSKTVTVARTGEAAESRRQREELAAKHGVGDVAPQARKAEPLSKSLDRKQPGRRYGPAPKPAPKHRGAPSPMSDDRREDIYTRSGGFTARQFRQLQRMGRRDLYRLRSEGADS